MKNCLDVHCHFQKPFFTKPVKVPSTCVCLRVNCRLIALHSFTEVPPPISCSLQALLLPVSSSCCSQSAYSAACEVCFFPLSSPSSLFPSKKNPSHPPFPPLTLLCSHMCPSGSSPCCSSTNLDQLVLLTSVCVSV